MADDRECHERVVLVSVKGGTKPRRKVAIALPPENDYAVFAERVRTKLNLSSIAGIYHAETNSPVHDLNELQDIDDLVVVEGQNGSPTSTPTHSAPEPRQVSAATTSVGAPPPQESQYTAHTSTSGGTLGTSSRKTSRSVAEGPQHTNYDMEDGGVTDSEETGDKKYVRRGNPAMRLAQQVLPHDWLPGPSLPVTAPGSASSGRKRRSKNSGMDPRKLLLLFALCSCFATMILLYSRISMGPALTASVMDDEREELRESESLILNHR